MTGGELAEGRIHPIHEQHWIAAACLSTVSRCLWSSGNSAAWELQEEDQGHPIKSSRFSKKKDS